jgi:hypothetical protein
MSKLMPAFIAGIAEKTLCMAYKTLLLLYKSILHDSFFTFAGMQKGFVERTMHQSLYVGSVYRRSFEKPALLWDKNH